MRFDYSKTINEQLSTFEYYKNRYCSYVLEIIKLQKQKQDLLNWLESKNNITLQQHNIVKPVIKVQDVIDKIKEDL